MGDVCRPHLTEVGDNHVSSPRSPGEHTPNPVFTLCGYVAMPRYFCSMDVGQDDGLLHVVISIALGEITTTELPV